MMSRAAPGLLLPEGCSVWAWIESTPVTEFSERTLVQPMLELCGPCSAEEAPGSPSEMFPAGGRGKGSTLPPLCVLPGRVVLNKCIPEMEVLTRGRFEGAGMGFGGHGVGRRKVWGRWADRESFTPRAVKSRTLHGPGSLTGTFEASAVENRVHLKALLM
ncbi:hypothetical protein IHE44_0010191 [Lamprotornis superbus]|uniref:Uncharacterized protein n=1 Tax=Lamprotornis superbus TaxID=245042 RepID=A0A835TQ69_9PASS|nr:hypothetical protein IHE44_0010191 [Lamprotornis superbus]